MFVASVRALFIVGCLFVAGCGVVVGPTTPVGSTSAPPPAATAVVPLPTAATSQETSLLPDESATYTLGDTARLSGGEFLGDQADLTVLEAVQLPPADNGDAQFAFLVEITGLDDASFHYNLLNFRLIDDQAFQYDALADGGAEPRLEFGDLSAGQKVRGWMTFAVSEPTSAVHLQYAPVTALESASFGFTLP